MSYPYDVCVIGLGPAGMAVSVMASHMGLKVLGIEPRGLGGECMSVGCIPSKALLRVASVRHLTHRHAALGLEPGEEPPVGDPLGIIRDHVHFVSEKKTLAMFSKVDLKLREGAASFVDDHTVEVGGATYRAKRIFLCVGTRPAVPATPGLREVDYLTNESLFSLEKIPESLVVIGGGAIGSEMAQAFSRLGARVSIVHMDAHLLPHGDPEAGELLERVFRDEGIEIYNHRAIRSVASDGAQTVVRTDHGETLVGERLLVAAGRSFDHLPALRLENAGVRYGEGGIEVDRTLRTSRRHIYAAGDCNG
ncbi:MAG: FAD-dependent oxidoreductase, partial [Candidatus Bipolaricaulota bacterium]